MSRWEGLWEDWPPLPDGLNIVEYYDKSIEFTTCGGCPCISVLSFALKMLHSSSLVGHDCCGC